MYGKYYYVYIMSNKYNTVYYVGITNTLERRAIEHKWKINKNSFTAKYNINKLLYFEDYGNPVDAIAREKQLKGWRREKKLNLIKKENVELKDLFE
ncbi:MAG: GIY-YIG nuclease family protein [bacterium]|nr:GIY-YIG nuclease family protein [bacterium]